MKTEFFKKSGNKIKEEDVDKIIIYDKFNNPIFLAIEVKNSNNVSHIISLRPGEDGFEEMLTNLNIKFPKIIKLQ